MRIGAISYRAFRVWQRNRDVFLRLWRSEFASSLAEPIIILFAMGFGLGGLVGLIAGQSYLEFIAPGILASYVMFAATFECTYSSFVRMEHQRTFDAIIATPVNIEDVIAGEIFWAATRSLITACSILLILTFFGLIHSASALFVLPVSMLSGLMFGSLAMLFTSLVPSINSFNYYFTLFITPMFFFSGVFFPLSNIPHLAQKVATFIPLTSAVQLNRSIMHSQFQLSDIAYVLYMFAIAAIAFFVSLVTMKKRLIK